MSTLKQTLSTLVVTAIMAMPAAMAQANLTPAEVSALDGKSGIRVLTSDGAYIGTTNGINIRQERTRMFLRPLQGSIFRRSHNDIVVTTLTGNLTLRGNDLVLADDKQRVRIKANYSASDDTPQVTILLLQRK